jgi:hypothetical protein
MLHLLELMCPSPSYPTADDPSPEDDRLLVHHLHQQLGWLRLPDRVLLVIERLSGHEHEVTRERQARH